MKKQFRYFFSDLNVKSKLKRLAIFLYLFNISKRKSDGSLNSPLIPKKSGEDVYLLSHPELPFCVVKEDEKIFFCISIYITSILFMMDFFITIVPIEEMKLRACSLGSEIVRKEFGKLVFLLLHYNNRIRVYEGMVKEETLLQTIQDGIDREYMLFDKNLNPDFLLRCLAVGQISFLTFLKFKIEALIPLNFKIASPLFSTILKNIGDFVEGSISYRSMLPEIFEEKDFLPKWQAEPLRKLHLMFKDWYQDLNMDEDMKDPEIFATYKCWEFILSDSPPKPSLADLEIILRKELEDLEKFFVFYKTDEPVSWTALNETFFKDSMLNPFLFDPVSLYILQDFFKLQRHQIEFLRVELGDYCPSFSDQMDKAKSDFEKISRFTYPFSKSLKVFEEKWKKMIERFSE